MSTNAVFYVGSEQQVGHHARPLAELIPLRIESLSTVLEEASPGDVAIFFSEHFSEFRRAILELRRRRVATLYAIDGILEWRNAWENRPDEPACPWTMRPVLSDKVACIGPSQARVLASWGQSQKIEIVGVPRFDHLINHDRSANRSPRSPDRAFRILVMTAKYPGFTSEQRDQIRQSLIDLKAWFSEPMGGAKKFDVTWRLTGGLDREIDVDNELRDTSGDDLLTALRKVDAVVTTPSTAQLESMLLGKPTAILDYTNSPHLVESAWKITASCQINAVMAQLQNPPIPRLHYQEYLLNDALQLQSSATERMAALIGKMSEVATEFADGDQPLKFDPCLLSPVGLPVNGLPISEIFPGYTAFQSNDLELMRMELAESEREVELLNHRIDGLTDELGQAHAIFDSIHRHPIAGPIVRTRQRVSDWWRGSNSRLDKGN